MDRTKIVGQNNLLDRIDSLIDEDLFPRFSLLVGSSGTGKKLIANYIADKLNCIFVPCSPKIEDVRTIIDMSYTLSSPTCYLWSDADNMSVGAKNAILKITEEPPESAYFIITLDNEQTMLPTILSRGTKFYIEPYSQNDLVDFIKLRNFDNDINVITQTCDCPKDIIDFNSYDILDFTNFVDKVINCIGNASCANSLKLSNSFKIKKDEIEKYNIKLFFKYIQSASCSLLKSTNDLRYAKLIALTCDCLSEFRLVSVNKLAVLDKWLLNARLIMRG